MSRTRSPTDPTSFEQGAELSRLAFVVASVLAVDNRVGMKDCDWP